jgi:acetoacetate decarboxylase
MDQEHEAWNWRGSAMKIDPSKIYLMPLIEGPIAEGREDLRYHYGEVEWLALQYQTDPDAIRPLLPDCFRLDEKPTVTIWFGYYDQVDFMAGRGYNEAAVQVAARFDGQQDHIEGDYVIVMLLNDTIPIIGGREHLGIPKVYADIPTFETQSNGHLLCKASLWDQPLIGMDLSPLKKQNAVVCFAASKRINGRPLLCYKYIPSLDGPPDADYPTTTRSDIKIDELWLGESGEISFGDPGIAAITKPWVKLLEVLNTIPVRQVTQTTRFRGSSVLRSDLCRRLR